MASPARAEPGVEGISTRALLTSRRIQYLLVLAFLAWSVVASGVSPSALAAPGALEGLLRLARGLIPPDLSPGFLAIVAAAVARTVAIGVAGTALAILLAIPLGLLATPTLFRPGALAAGRGPGTAALFVAHLAARAVLRIFRAVPTYSGRSSSSSRWASGRVRVRSRSGSRMPVCSAASMRTCSRTSIRFRERRSRPREGVGRPWSSSRSFLRPCPVW